MAIYNQTKQLIGETALEAADIRAELVDADYTFSAAHATFADVPSGARLGLSGSLSISVLSDGKIDAADTTITDVTGTVTGIVVMLYDTGTPANSKLLAHLDQDSGGAISLAASNQPVLIAWSANGIIA